MTTVNVIKQDKNEVEIELWNSITKIVKLREDIPELNIGKALELMESEINRIKDKGKIALNRYVTDGVALLTEDKSKQKHKEVISNNIINYDEHVIGSHVEGRHEKTKFDGNPWDVKVNIWSPCEICGVTAVQTLAVHADNDKRVTHIYKAFEHPNEKKKSHWIPVETFQGKLDYKQILKQKSNPKKL